MSLNKLQSLIKQEPNESILIKILAEIFKVWAEFDVDDNGLLSFEEAQEYFKTGCSPMPDDQ